MLYRGVAEDVMRNARTYLVISAVSYPFLSVYYSCAALASLISRMAACFILRLLDRNSRFVIRSHPGRGTAVVLYLPLVENEEEFEE